MKTKVSKKIQLKPSRSCLKCQGNEVCVHRAWKKSYPFCVNPRGVLIHRVRHVSTIVWSGKDHHHTVDYLCGNGCNFDLGMENEVLVSDPPKDRLLCDACEFKAQRHRLPSGDELAGRHVHRGVLVARQVCCPDRALVRISHGQKND